MRGMERRSAWVYGCLGAWKISSTGACSTTRPRYITATSVAISATTPRSWVMSMIAIPSSRCSWRIKSRIWVCVVTSSAVVGSSAISRVGWHDSAIAIMARWRRPPLSWLESWSTRCSGEDTPTRRSISIAFARASRRLDLLVEHDRLDDLAAHGVHGAERGHRLLEDEGDLRPADGPHLGAVRAAAWPGPPHPSPPAAPAGRPAEPDLARDDPARAIHDPEDRAGGDALAAAALARRCRGSRPDRGRSSPRRPPSRCPRPGQSTSSGPGRTGAARRLSAAIGVRGVPEAVAEEVEGHDHDDHGHRGQHQPRRDRHRLDVLGLLQQDPPADRGRAQAQAEEARARSR